VHSFTFGGAASAKAAGGGFGAPASGGFGIFGAPGSGFGFGGASPGGFSFGSTAAGAAKEGPLPGSYCLHTKHGFGGDTVTKVRVLSYIQKRLFGEHPYQCLNVNTNTQFGAYGLELQKIPDNELTPLEMSFREPFRPSRVLQHKGILQSAKMNVEEMIRVLDVDMDITPEYDNLAVRWGPKEGTLVGGVSHGLIQKLGWADGEAMTGLLYRMASAFDALTTRSTQEEVLRYFQRCNATGKPKTLLIDPAEFWKGGPIILSPKGSKRLDKPNPDPDKYPSEPQIEDLTHDSPPAGLGRLIDRMSPPPSDDTRPTVSKPVKMSKYLDLESFDDILMPINNNNAHWLLGRIRPKDRTTVIYDSLGFGSATWLRWLVQFRDDVWSNKKDVKSQLISPVTGALLSEVEMRTYDAQSERQWVNSDNYTKPMGYPNQEDASACGVFVMTWIAYILRQQEDKIVTDVTHYNIDHVFREWLGRMLCEEAENAV